MAHPSVAAPRPFPNILGMLLGGSVKIVNHGFPGDRTSEGLRRWKDTKGGKISFIMYGTNDAGNFGQLPGGRLGVNQYTQNLEALATRRLRDGAEVVILLPPPAMDPSFEAALQPYREAARDVAGRLGAPVLDTRLVLAPVEKRWVDGIHLSVQSNQAIAAAIKNDIVHYAQ